MSKNPITSRAIEHLVHNANPANQTIARASTVPKRSGSPPPIHPGMTSKQVAGMNAGGLSHPLGSVPDASSANPLDPTVPGKNLQPVKLAPGMRNRTSPGGTQAHLALGKAIMDEALRGAPGDHPAKLGSK
jgi:hypothetical protein